MAMGLGAFTEGLQSGIKARDQMDIAKQYKEKMRQENTQGAIDLQETYDMRLNEWMNNPDNKGQTEQDFLAANPGYSRYTPSRDPALIRFGKWLGKKTGLFNEEAGAQQGLAIAPRTAQQTYSPIPEENMPPTKLMPQFADGGQVNPFAVRQDMYANPQPWERVQEGWGEYESRAAERDKRREGASDIERGNINREGFLDVVGSSVGVVGRGAVDAIDQSIPDVAKGFLGVQDSEASTPTASGHPERKTVANPYTTNNPHFDPNIMSDASNGNGDEKAAANATASAPARSDTEIADQAIDDGKMMALENLDFRTLTAQGLTPNDLPQMPTNEWTQYRREMMDSLIAKGKDPSEALKITDDMTVGVQMRGIQRYGQQAVMLLNAGLQDEAAMAMTMAFQYFPNGVNVQWANFDDPQTGRPALVARGFDEETGEPKGSPTLITVDRLNTMIENMSNPQAFRTWTKDNRQLQLDIAKHKETVSHNATMEDIYGYGAETDRINANTRRMYPSGYGNSGSDGMTPSEQRMRSELFSEDMKELMMSKGYGDYFEDPRIRHGVVNVLDSLQSKYPTAAPGNLVEYVMRAFDGGMQQGGSVEAAMQAVESLLKVSDKG